MNVGLTCTFGRSILMWNVLCTVLNFGGLSTLGLKQWVPLNIVGKVPICTLTPRLILNMRDMYERSTVYGGRGNGIDTGFGLTTLSSRGASRSSIVFADGGEREGLEHDSEDIRMERRVA